MSACALAPSAAEPKAPAKSPPAKSPVLLRTPALSSLASAMKAGPSTSRQPHAMVAGTSSSLPAFQEHAAVLRDHLVAVEETLDTVPPEDYSQLKRALLQVSKMISQMESVADALSDRRLSLRNELRTLQDENVHLHGALVRERRKFHGRERRGSATSPRGGRKLPPLLPRRDSSLIYNPIRPFIFPASTPRYRPFDDNDSFLIDLTFEGTGGSASTSRVASGPGVNPGPSGSGRRGRGISRGGRSASHVAGTKRPPCAKRGRGSATRSRPRPSLRTLNSTDSNASAISPNPTSPGFLQFAGPAPAQQAPLTPEPPFPTGQNDINDMNHRLNNRNNKLAGKRMFSIFDSVTYLN